MLIALRVFLLGFLLFLMPQSIGFAQTTTPDQPTITIDKKRLLVLPRNADGSVQETAFLEDPVLWVREKQQAFYGKMSGSLRAIRSSHANSAAFSLFMLSFLYGVFHAAGPGHGKAIISAWLLATENDFRRGLFVAFMSALFQALTAIVMVSVLLLVVASAGMVARNLTGYLESASYAMIGLMGLYLIYTVFRTSVSRLPKLNAVQATSEGAFAHPAFAENFTPAKASAEHVHDANCGHVHAPNPEDLRDDWSWFRGITMSFAIGLRPCTGAILVLILANALGLYWAGVLATLAMGFGTFLTVSVIAGLTVFAKSWTLRLASRDSVLAARLVSGLRLVGGIVILAFGVLLFWGSLGAPNSMV